MDLTRPTAPTPLGGRTQQPRAEGAGRLRAVRGVSGTGLATLGCRGSAKILLPRTPGPSLDAVLINTAGGLTGGDRFDWNHAADPGADLTLTTQAAERAYRAQPGEEARIRTRLTLAPAATLHWLPQETILFDRAALSRTLEVEIAGDASFLGVESFVFGRAAMGERVRGLDLSERWEVRREGRVIFADALRIADAGALDRPACLCGARAVATILRVAPDATAGLGPLRELFSHVQTVEAGASAFDGLLICRMMAADGYTLRPALARALTLLGGRPLPRVWTT